MVIICVKNYTEHCHDIVHVLRKYSNASSSYSAKTKRDGQTDGLTGRFNIFRPGPSARQGIIKWFYGPTMSSYSSNTSRSSRPCQTSSMATWAVCHGRRLQIGCSVTESPSLSPRTARGTRCCSSATTIKVNVNKINKVTMIYIAQRVLHPMRWKTSLFVGNPTIHFQHTANLKKFSFC